MIQYGRRSGRFSFNTLGIFNADGISELYEIDTKNNALKYLNLLRDRIIPTIRDKYPEPTEVVLFQDRCSIHQAGIVQNYLRSLNNFSLITTPAKGSDMNPIEHIWAMMVRRIKTEPTWNIDQFHSEVHIAWEWCIGKEDY